MQCNNLINLDFALLCTINDNEIMKLILWKLSFIQMKILNLV